MATKINIILVEEENGGGIIKKKTWSVSSKIWTFEQIEHLIKTEIIAHIKGFLLSE